MDSEYQQSSEQRGHLQDPEQGKPRRRPTKNEQIYGDFQQAYEPQRPAQVFSKKSYSYQMFKAGQTIQKYSSQIEVQLPKTKPKTKSKQAYVQQLQQELDDRPMLGQFTLNSFLNQLGGDQLNDIQQEQNQDSSQNVPIGLNDRIMKHLELFKMGEEQTEEPVNMEELTFQRYMKMGKPAVAKQEPKYKSQQEKELAKFYSNGYGVGFKMMEKMGFKNINKGLGKNETGTHKPVEAVMKTAFTMKDDQHNHKKKNKGQSDSEAEKEQEQTKEISIPEQFFKYRSRNFKINNFLVDLQRQYERLSSQVYFIENEVQSMKNKTELSLNNQVQQQKESSQLKRQIEKLTTLSENVEKCEEFPHLGQHYQIDLLQVKKTYQKLKQSTIANLHIHADIQINKLKSCLNRFYLAKSKESMKMFQQKTGIQQKMNKRIKKGNKKEDVIDLDRNSSDDQIEMLTIGVDEEQKINKFVNLIISKTVVPVIQQALRKVDTLQKIKDSRIIDLIDMVKKLEEKASYSKNIVRDYIRPCFQNYVKTINWSQIESQSSKLLPHLVILPWLHLLKSDQKFTLMPFYRKLATKLWSIQNSMLYNIYSAFHKFSSLKEVNFFVNLYLSPLILNQLQSFSINDSNMALLNGFIKYSQFLSFQIREEILQNTLFLKVHQVYKKYVKEKEQNQVHKWLKNWKKFSDKVAPGKFDSYFQQIITSHS